MLPLPSGRLLAAAATSLVLLAGCTDASPTDATITLDQPTPEARETPTPETTPSPGDETAELAACSEDDRRSLVAAVDGQLDAIADQAWTDALTFSTPGFREGIDADAFASIITDSFPVVAAVVARDIGPCQVSETGDEATMVVTVEDTDGTRQALLYLFERGDVGWGIDGALPAGDPGSDEPQLTA